MKHISKAINQNQILQGSADSYKPISPQKTPLAEKLITRLFSVMMMKYTHRWASQFPDKPFTDEAKKIWAQDLSGLTNEQIKQGLDKTIEEYPTWPPTVGEFKQLCEVGKDSWRLHQLSLPDKSKKAITPEERKAIIAKHGDNLHKALKGEYVETS